MKSRKWIPLALMLACQGASAGDWYVLGAVTHSKDSLKKGTFDSALSVAGATALSSSDSGGSNQWRLQLGYDVNPYLSLEAGYIDLGKSKYTATYTGGSASGELKAGGLDFAALGKLPLTDNFSIFAKGGVMAIRAKSSLNATAPAAAASGSNSSSKVVPLIGVGALYKVSENFDLRAEFDRVSNIGKSDKTGTMDSNMISVGVAYHF